MSEESYAERLAKEIEVLETQPFSRFLDRGEPGSLPEVTDEQAEEMERVHDYIRSLNDPDLQEDR